MGSFTMPETILGVPLWVPATFDYFDIEAAAMPNGDPCLAVRGDVNTSYKAFQAAPTMSPYNICNLSDMTSLASTGNAWSMSIWLKLANLAANAPSNALMFGCSAEDANGFWNTTGRNATTPFIMGAGSGAKNVWEIYREPLNNISSPDGPKTIHLSGSWENFQDYWHLFVFTIERTATPELLANVYLDTYSSQTSDTASISGTPGSYSSPRYLYLGGYPLSSVGRADLWRCAKWAFHDHKLTQAERQSMWDAMYTTPLVFVDDFNDAIVGTNWGALQFATTMIMSGTEATGAANTTVYGNYWVRDLGSTKHYAQAIFTGASGDLNKAIGCRLPPYSPSTQTGYWAGWDSTQWSLARNATGIATAAGPISYPCTVRLETEAAAGNSVDIRFYVNGVLKISFNDTNAARILTGSNTGITMRGNSGATPAATNWECGRF